MKRQRRKRSTRRRGLQHVGDVLSSIMAEIDQDEAQASPAAAANESAIPVAAVTASSADSQNTFSFYQPVDM